MLHLCMEQNKCLLLETAERLQKKSPHQPELNGVHLGVTVPQAVAQLLAAKRIANRRPVYVKSLSHYLSRFATGCGVALISQLTPAVIEKWLSQFPSPSSRQTWLNRISTFCAFCVRRDFLQFNPCDKIERVTVDHKPPIIFTVEQTRLLLKTCPTVCKPWLVLTTFAGIRPDGEIGKVEWEHIDLDTATARIDFPKVRKHRRIVPLEPIVVKLLREHPIKKGLVAPSRSTLRRFKRKMRALLGFDKWPQDVTRHTAASYLVALHKDAGKVAAMLGNSTSILMSHYHEPVNAPDCAAFWSLPIVEGPPKLNGAEVGVCPLVANCDQIELRLDLPRA